MRVADRFGLLTTGDRAAAPRQRTLRAAIDWSHDLLTEREQVLLRRLSVFAGWSLEMAEQVCTDDLVPAAGVLDTVAALVDKSLVVREPEVLGQARFRMLDTIREYAAEKLALAGEATAVQHRFRDHTLGVAERNFAGGHGAGARAVAGPGRRVPPVRRGRGERLAGAQRVPGRGRRRDRAADLHGDPAVHAGARRVRPRLRVDRRLPLPAGGGRRRPADQGPGAHRARPAVPAGRPGRRGAGGAGRASSCAARRATSSGRRPGSTCSARSPCTPGGPTRPRRSAGRRWRSPRPRATAGTRAGRSASAPRSPGVRGNIARGGRAGPAPRSRSCARSTTGGASPGPSSASATSPGCAATWRGAQLMYGDALGYLREIDAQAGDRPLPVRPRPGRRSTSATSRPPGSTWRRACGSAGTSARASGWPAALSRSPRSRTATATRSAPCCSPPRRPGCAPTSGLPPPPGARAGRLPRRRPPPRRGHGRAAAVGTRPRAVPRGRHRPGDRAARPGTRGRGRAHGPRAAPPSAPPSGLTPRELEIAALIARRAQQQGHRRGAGDQPGHRRQARRQHHDRSWASGPGRRSPPGSPSAWRLPGGPAGDLAAAARASSTVSSAAGSASSRWSGIGLPLSTERP